MKTDDTSFIELQLLLHFATERDLTEEWSGLLEEDLRTTTIPFGIPQDIYGIDASLGKQSSELQERRRSTRQRKG